MRIEQKYREMGEEKIGRVRKEVEAEEHVVEES